MSISNVLSGKERKRAADRDSLYVGKQISSEKWNVLRESLPGLPSFKEVEPHGGGYAFIQLLNAIESNSKK